MSNYTLTQIDYYTQTWLPRFHPQPNVIDLFPVSHFPRCFHLVMGVSPFFLGVSGYEQEAVGGARNKVNRPFF